jgi:adenylylsulfate kinase
MDNNICKKKSGLILWFTGLSGSGKTTIAERISVCLQESNISVQIFDGDQVRTTRHRHLGFSERDIKTNNELIVNICVEDRKFFDVVIVPIISPYSQSRREARIKLQPRFYEIYFSANLDCVRQRDVKGLYAKSDSGIIKNMIGLSSVNPYQPPESPDLIIDTENESIQQSVEKLLQFSMKHHTVSHC